MLTTRDALTVEPGMTKRALIKRAKSIAYKKDAGKRLEHASSLECQGLVFRYCEDSAASMWSSVVQKLPSELMKFSLNAVQDTLPHNDNLARWRKNEGLSSSCKLCGERQTLLRVLNACPKALSLRRYNERHDAVLEVLATFLAGTLPEGYTLITDLPQFQPYLFPPHIAHTDERPDMVVWNYNIREVWVIELTVYVSKLVMRKHTCGKQHATQT